MEILKATEPLARTDVHVYLGSRRRAVGAIQIFRSGFFAWWPYQPVRLCGIFILASACALTGCTTRAKAKQEARAAYIAGREQAERMMQSRNNVTVMGPVRNQQIPWTEDLTLAKALVFADYTGKGTPQEIIVVRNGAAQRIDPNELLAGRDIPLLQGDIIQIR